MKKRRNLQSLSGASGSIRHRSADEWRFAAHAANESKNKTL